MEIPRTIHIADMINFTPASHLDLTYSDEAIDYREVAESIEAQDEMQCNIEELEEAYVVFSAAHNRAMKKPEDISLQLEREIAVFWLENIAYDYEAKETVPRYGAKWLLTRVMFHEIVADYDEEFDRLAGKHEEPYLTLYNFDELGEES